jgi:hypothetical protein
MPSARYEPAIPAIERLHIYALKLYGHRYRQTSIKEDYDKVDIYFER